MALPSSVSSLPGTRYTSELTPLTSTEVHQQHSAQVDPELILLTASSKCFQCFLHEEHESPEMILCVVTLSFCSIQTALFSDSQTTLSFKVTSFKEVFTFLRTRNTTII